MNPRVDLSAGSVFRQSQIVNKAIPFADIRDWGWKHREVR